MKIKNTYLLVIFLGFIAFILIVIGFLTAFPKKNLPTQVQNQAVSPSPAAQQYTSPNTNLNYVPGSATKDLQRLIERAPLSASDTAVKNNILERLGNKSGSPYQNSDFAINYVVGPNDFEVEITTKEIDKAKEEAISWFKSQGLTDQGICNLPVTFYVIDTVKNSLPSETSFDPNPPNCN